MYLLPIFLVTIINYYTYFQYFMPTCFRICAIRLGSIFPALILLIFLTDVRSAYAQANFVPLERGDVSEREENLTFSPGLKLSGDY